MSANFTLCVGTVGSGAWTSPDGGDSWQRVRSGLWGESRIYGMAVHPREPRTASPAPMTASTRASTAGGASNTSTRR